MAPSNGTIEDAVTAKLRAASRESVANWSSGSTGWSPASTPTD